MPILTDKEPTVPNDTRKFFSKLTELAKARHDEAVGDNDQESISSGKKQDTPSYNAKPTHQWDPEDFQRGCKMFDWIQKMFICRAPGRLDVMGGIADYSGSLVLQLPLAEACHAAVQVRKDGGNLISVLSLRSKSDGCSSFSMDASSLFDSTGKPISFKEAKSRLKEQESTRWVAYIVGCLVVLLQENPSLLQDKPSISIFIDSDVPEGKGVSSSASVEIATMSALCTAFGIQMTGYRTAELCQVVENYVVGAPCGIMDQMSSALGKESCLLSLLCRPAEVLGQVTIPDHIQFWGLDSGLKHCVDGDNYGDVRVGAFMGRSMIQSFAKANLDPSHPASKHPFHLTQLSPHEFAKVFAGHIPEQIAGSEFLERYPEGHGDEVTKVCPDTTYKVLAPTMHPINEMLRVQLFAQLMRGEANEDQLSLLGELMYQSHESYSQCGLGSPGTDKLVDYVRAAKSEGLYGAKITGGGSGGTVCILAEKSDKATKAVLDIAKRYHQATGQRPYIFCGSSCGAGAFRYLGAQKRPSLGEELLLFSEADPNQ